MPLKRTVIEAAATGGLQISREKLSGHSGNAKQRRTKERGGAERHYKRYATHETAALNVDAMPHDVKKWFTNVHWPVHILPLGTEEIQAQADTNDAAAQWYKIGAQQEAERIADKNATFAIKPAIKRRVVFIDETHVPLKHWSDWHTGEHKE